MKNDLLMAMDKGQVTLLVLLDLSSAFDTVKYEILLERLRSTIGLWGKVLSWFESYLKDRSQQVSINRTLSKPFDLKCGVTQGSCLGPLLFTDNGRLLERPSVKTEKTLGDRAFQVAAAFLWNKLPRSAREATNLESFKTLIKTFLFKYIKAQYK